MKTLNDNIESWDWPGDKGLIIIIVYVTHVALIFVCRRDFRLLTGEPDPSSPTPQPVLWFANEVQPQVNLHAWAL